MHTDPIADMLTRIRNGLMANHERVSASHSKIKANILKVMKAAGFIVDYKEEGEGIAKVLTIDLNDDRRDLTLKRISKPGQRIYIKKDEVKKIKNGLGMTIISTSQGIMSNQEAYKKGLGGELICEIY